MPVIEAAADLPYPVGPLFDLIVDVERYPAFLPWVTAVEVVGREGARTQARVSARHEAFALELRAEMRAIAPLQVDIRAAGWWFARLESRWRLSTLPDGTTRVAHTLDYRLSVPVLSSVARPLVARAVPKVMARFRARADALLGGA
jgi:coenzyme Q-binding protein COQ10